MIHHDAVGRADGGDDEGLLCALRGEDVESFGVFAGSDVVEVGITAVEERGNATRFNVTNNFRVFLAIDFEIGVAGQRRDGDDRGVELLGCDW